MTSMNLLAHITPYEIAGVVGIFLLGIVTGLALARQLGGRWSGRD